MDAEKRKRLEAAGWKVGTVQEFLGLTDAEMAEIELKRALHTAVSDWCDVNAIEPAMLAKLARRKVSEVRAVLARSPYTTLDNLFACYFALGGKLSDLSKPKRKPKPKTVASR